MSPNELAAVLGFVIGPGLGLHEPLAFELAGAGPWTAIERTSARAGVVARVSARRDDEERLLHARVTQADGTVAREWLFTWEAGRIRVVRRFEVPEGIDPDDPPAQARARWTWRWAGERLERIEIDDGDDGVLDRAFELVPDGAVHRVLAVPWSPTETRTTRVLTRDDRGRVVRDAPGEGSHPADPACAYRWGDDGRLLGLHLEVRVPPAMDALVTASEEWAWSRGRLDAITWKLRSTVETWRFSYADTSR